MTELILDAAKWACPDDVYLAFFRAVGAPEWHGRNFNALRDSIAAGSINRVEVPYRLVIQNYDEATGPAVSMAENFVSLIRELGAGGVPVEIEIR